MLALTAGCFAVEIWAFVDCLRRPDRAFTSEGKKTRKFWALLLGVVMLLGFVGLEPPFGRGFGLTTLIIAIPAFIYFADVRPAIAPYGFGNGSNNSGGRNRGGGW